MKSSGIHWRGIARANQHSHGPDAGWKLFSWEQFLVLSLLGPCSSLVCQNLILFTDLLRFSLRWKEGFDVTSIFTCLKECNKAIYLKIALQPVCLVLVHSGRWDGSVSWCKHGHDLLHHMKREEPARTPDTKFTQWSWLQPGGQDEKAPLRIMRNFLGQNGSRQAFNPHLRILFYWF